MKRVHALIILVLILSILSIPFVLATTTPEGPQTLTVVNSSRRTPAPSSSLQATAGNVTHLNIAANTVTQSWQGFVGNITGTITLDDSRNNTLYDWQAADPEGEIYATYLQTVDWSLGNVQCWNWTHTVASYLQLVELETNPAAGDGAPNVYGGIGALADDPDGVNETFTAPGLGMHASFYVGSQLINGSLGPSCPITRLYNSTGQGTFQEVILYHDGTGASNDGVIYTAIINQSVIGYDTQRWDFEMIVGENGHEGDVTPITYYFYVELQ
ncbi:hypothetical protein J4464_05830 [Candidatus Woesearchaeota archaeon]|nr:hypothetical protein [Candidatus Woesearchaeota archaeon]